MDNCVCKELAPHHKDFKIPEGLSLLGRQAAVAILAHVTRKDPKASGGGCRAFYTPEEWKERGEKYGTTSVLVICHDGGDMCPYFSLDYGWEMAEGMNDVLRELGLYAEACTGWYTAIYPE